MKYNLGKIFLYTSLAISTTWVLLSAYWGLRPYRIIEFKETPLPVLTKQVNVGEKLRYELNYCKYMGLSSEISTSFIDGVIFDTPSFRTNRQVGCHETIVEIKVPSTLPSGTYYVQIHYHYKVNPIRSVNYSIKTESFEIIN
jgi:hypothetical protein